MKFRFCKTNFRVFVYFYKKSCGQFSIRNVLDMNDVKKKKKKEKRLISIQKIESSIFWIHWNQCALFHWLQVECAPRWCRDGRNMLWNTGDWSFWVGRRGKDHSKTKFNFCRGNTNSYDQNLRGFSSLFSVPWETTDNDIYKSNSLPAVTLLSLLSFFSSSYFLKIS